MQHNQCIFMWPRFWSLILWSHLWTHFIAFSAHINMYTAHSMLNDTTMSFKACSDANSNYDGSCHKGFEKALEQQLLGLIPSLHHVLIKTWVYRYLSWYWNRKFPCNIQRFHVELNPQACLKGPPSFGILAQAPSSQDIATTPNCLSKSRIHWRTFFNSRMML